MGELKLDDQRYFPRYHAVADNFAGKLFREEDLSEIPGQVMDVSRDGIGILVTTPQETGQHVVLRFSGKSVVFVVRHCQEDLIFKGKYRAGLMRVGSTKENLLQLFSLHGFLA